MNRTAATGPAVHHVGDLAIVLHSHMPYVEGFGTYPFGEEWLFDAFARSHVAVLETARDLTVTVTPVLADQLEAPGVAARMRRFLEQHRVGAAEKDATDAAAELRPAARAEADRYARALERMEALGEDLTEAFRAPAREGRISLMPSSATHAVLPLLATRQGTALQLDAGLRSHHRRFGAAEGFWLPECAYRPGLDQILAEHGIRFTCVDQSTSEAPLDALAPVETPAGPVAFTIDWPSISLVWGQGGYPSSPEYLEYHRLSENGTRLWAIGRAPFDAEAARARAEAHAKEFAASVAARLEAYKEARGRPGLVVFAIDTELLGAWWSEGPTWLAATLEAAPRHGVRLVTLPAALDAHEPEPRPLAESSWGEGKDLSTWDSPEVADLAWGARRLELRLLHALGSAGVGRPALERAARELLAVQSSDWAFLDRKGQAGDYAYRRSVTHAQGLLNAIDSPESPDPRLRNLAPDMSLAPLLEP